MVTHNAGATNKFKAEEARDRISEVRKSSVSAMKIPSSRGVTFGFGFGFGLESGGRCHWETFVYGGMDGRSTCKRLMLIPMATHAKTIEDAMKNNISG